MRRFILFTVIIALGGTANLLAQETYRLAQANSSVVVMGTSTSSRLGNDGQKFYSESDG